MKRIVRSPKENRLEYEQVGDYFPALKRRAIDQNDIAAAGSLESIAWEATVVFIEACHARPESFAGIIAERTCYAMIHTKNPTPPQAGLRERFDIPPRLKKLLGSNDWHQGGRTGDKIGVLLLWMLERLGLRRVKLYREASKFGAFKNIDALRAYVTNMSDLDKRIFFLQHAPEIRSPADIWCQSEAPLTTRWNPLQKTDDKAYCDEESKLAAKLMFEEYPELLKSIRTHAPSSKRNGKIRSWIRNKFKEKRRSFAGLHPERERRRAKRLLTQTGVQD